MLCILSRSVMWVVHVCSSLGFGICRLCVWYDRNKCELYWYDAMCVFKLWMYTVHTYIVYLLCIEECIVWNCCVLWCVFVLSLCNVHVHCAGTVFHIIMRLCVYSTSVYVICVISIVLFHMCCKCTVCKTHVHVLCIYYVMHGCTVCTVQTWCILWHDYWAQV